MNTARSLRFVVVSLCALWTTTAMPAAELPETAPDFLWAVQAGGPIHDKTRGLATDAAGNIYLTGEFGKTATFGDFTVESKGDLDFFVAKYSPEGKCLWVRTGGGSKTDRGYAVAVDPQGNVFATGHSQSADATFDGTALGENRGNYDLFIVKYDANGKLLWLKSGGGPGYDYGHGIGVDQAGNCYVTGAIVGDYEFAGIKGTNSKWNHQFLIKLSPAGELAWLRLAAGAGGCEGESLAVDGDGNIVVAGSISGTATIGDATVTGKAGRDALAVKYDTNGKVLWTFTGDGSTTALFSSVDVDGHGQVSLCGMFKGTLALGGQKIESQGDNDFLCAKLDRNGKFRWVKTGGGPETDYALCVAADETGNSYVTGEFQKTATIGDASMTAQGIRDLYVAKFDDSGALRWLRTAGGTSGALGYCVVRDGAGHLYISGAFDGTATFGQTTFKSKGSNDIMLLQTGK
jgi:hypothetical protein